MASIFQGVIHQFSRTIQVFLQKSEKVKEEEDIESPKESEQSISIKQDAVPLRKSNAKHKEINIIKLTKDEITFARNTRENASKT